MQPLASVVEDATFSVPLAPLVDRTERVAKVASLEADSVDISATFPRRAIDAAKSEGLLGLLVPTELGGDGATISDVAEVCFRIAMSCASTAMILAMHSAALACVVRHRRGSTWHDQLLRIIASKQLLLASSTTEGKGGGNLRASVAPLITSGDDTVLHRQATVLSYGAEADAIVTTARRHAECRSSDQSLVVFTKENYKLTRTATWKTLGMRGTRSAGFDLKAAAPAEQVLPDPYSTIHHQTMMPVSHLVWCSVWAGVATSAVQRSQAFVRIAARRSNGVLPPGSVLYPKAVAALNALRAQLSVALTSFESIRDDAAKLTSLETQSTFNLLKIEISEKALATVLMSLQICGLAGYRCDGDFSLERNLRDILSASIMINNERILANVTHASLMTTVSTTLRRR